MVGGASPPPPPSRHARESSSIRNGSHCKRARAAAPAASGLVEQEQSFQTRSCCDLFVPLVLSKTRSTTTQRRSQSDEEEDTNSSQLVQRQILLHRLKDVGFTIVAFANMIYGPPQMDRDFADDAMPLDKDDVTNTNQKKTKESIKSIRRLHVVVENLSDVGLFATLGEKSRTGEQQCKKKKSMDDLLRSYDLISLAPGNEVSFQAVCNTATAAEIITLDYTINSGGAGASLPYRIRSRDVRAAVARNATFEIPYAPALVNSKVRRKLILCCRDFQTASAGLKPRIIISPGPRTFLDSKDGRTVKDALDMAIRTPGDIQNLVRTVLRFDGRAAFESIFLNGNLVINRGLQRRVGNAVIQNVQFDQSLTTTKISPNLPKQWTSNVAGLQVDKTAKKSSALQTTASNDSAGTEKEHQAESAEGDGFISF